MVLLKTLFTIYPKNDKQNIVIKVCKIAPTPLTPFFWPTPPTPKFYGPALPTPPTPKFDPRHPRTHTPTHPRYPRHPRDLADSS